MKRCFTIGLLLLLLASIAQAAVSDFLVLDQNKGTIIRFDANLKAQPDIEIGARPSTMLDLGTAGYAVLCRGSAKIIGGDQSGAIVYLDRQFRPTARRINIPGIVTRDFYLKDQQLWVIISTPNGKEDTVATVSIAGLSNASVKSFPLKGAATAYAFNTDRSRFAVTTLGNDRNKVSPELALIELAAMKLSAYKVSVNPGAIFFRKENQIAVACSGYRPKQRYPSNLLLEEFEVPIQAALHWINPANGKNDLITLGYSPLVVTADRNDPAVLYLVSTDGADPVEPAVSLYRIVNGQIAAKQGLAFDVAALIQAANGNLCILGGHDFRLLEPAGLKVLASYQSEMDLDELRLNPNGTTAYLSASNSAYMDVLDLGSGKKVATIKLGRIGLFGSIGLYSLFGELQSPVIGASIPVDDKQPSYPSNRRMIFSDDFSMLYVLYSAEIAVIDLKNNQLKATIRFGLGNTYGIHATPNRRFIVVPTDTTWYFIDTKLSKLVLQVKLSEINDGSGIGYYSPNGQTLIIPYNNQLTIVDASNGKLIGHTSAKTPLPLVVWPQ